MTRAAHRFSNDLRYREADHPHQTALTPPYILEPIRRMFGGIIALDPCTTPDNPVGADLFYAPPEDGLTLPWDVYGGIYVNPPYGKAREPWVHRCIRAGAEGHHVALLMPAHPDTRVFQIAANTADGVLFLRGRVKFGIPRENGRQMAASHPSALFAWNADLTLCGELGVILEMHRMKRRLARFVIKDGDRQATVRGLV